jgi:hypothetical protein
MFGVTMKSIFKTVIIVATSLILVACGGGGGGSAGTTPAAPTISTVMSIGNHTNQVANYAAGDLNGDGLEDVVVSGWNSDVATAYIYIMIQNADGTLTDKTSQLLANNVVSGSQRILIGDFDADGHMDIFIPGFADGTRIYGEHSVMFWGASGQYVRDDWSDVNSAHGACVADMNNDGKPDLLVGGGSANDNAVGGVYINNGNRHFTLNNTVLADNDFAACAVVKTNSENIIYFAGVNYAAGYRDAITTFDFSLNITSTVGMQNDNTMDTIDVVVADLDGNGQKDFVVSIDGVNVPDAGPRKIITTAGAILSTLETKRSMYFGRALSNTSVFFSGDTNNASVFQGLTKYKASSFTDMASSSQSFIDAFVYQNAQGKLYMLELLNGVYKTREM